MAPKPKPARFVFTVGMAPCGGVDHPNDHGGPRFGCAELVSDLPPSTFASVLRRSRAAFYRRPWTRAGVCRWVCSLAQPWPARFQVFTTGRACRPSDRDDRQPAEGQRRRNAARASAERDAVTTMRMAMTALVALITTMAHAEPLPVPKTGQCPSGYRESGGYCAPMTERGHLSRSPSKGSARQTGCNRATTASTRAGAEIARNDLEGVPSWHQQQTFLPCGVPWSQRLLPHGISTGTSLSAIAYWSRPVFTSGA